MCYITYNAITGSAPSYLSELLHLYSPSHSLHSNSNASTAKPMAFALFHTLAPTSGTISSKTWGTLLLSLPSKANSRHFSSQNISAKQHCPSPLSVCTMCVCVCVCIFCIVMLEPLSTLCVSFFLLYIYTVDNISISMYIMCVILCLFSTLSCRVGALQISIIIIKKNGSVHG